MCETCHLIIWINKLCIVNILISKFHSLISSWSSLIIWHLRAWKIYFNVNKFLNSSYIIFIVSVMTLLNLMEQKSLISTLSQIFWYLLFLNLFIPLIIHTYYTFLCSTPSSISPLYLSLLLPLNFSVCNSFLTLNVPKSIPILNASQYPFL